MSASTIAAMAANPAASNNASLTLDSNSKPNARRRTVVVVEKKSSADILADGGANGVSEDKITVNGKDLAHTIRGESVLEISKDMPQLKKGLIASSISPRRKKPVPKPMKLKWQTILSILTKNCLLLAALLWLGQTVWRWTDRIGDHTNSPFVALDYEGRISEVEASLKKTAKMLQVQVDLVDGKIGSEIHTMARELKKQLEEKGALLEKELKKLEARTDGLDKSLTEFKGMGLRSREEFDSLWSELKNTGRLDGSDNNVNLDEIRVFARDLVKKEMEKHAADGLGRVDYALASGGARVVRHSEPYGFGKANGWFSVPKGQNVVHANAHKMLEPSFGEPGQCFPLQGSSGFVEIRLRSGIIPEAVTLEHVSKSVAYDRSSAPKDCRVSAWFESPDDEPFSHAKMYLLSEFSYDLDKSNAQTFNVVTADMGVVNMVRLDFASNHGSSALTCIYRFRVHGYEPNPPAAMALQAR
ncbi:SUN domain-containing protein 1-like [Phoenix dactylifera]|uniref:SUN domain-containing protein 1-like n=1 Tax=Phoenix dactylifera TaxID=42345 RepID=A0A8B7CHL4_PHODC|nr:SUN domain-containing protein 1-like [Phoenix dactylifera]XP_008799126.1 SUN domain-containing protein 1-like [Phoenix dactylifera]XP_017699934.1 SUN domain-containing protein 1-like [Phoenix dactylifera]XP_038978942.1 SUN domain-containing protein 1-like [Phoenix dactylifera]XP_038978943.1 SUN domain-containing protein 1-like [Phoenix dactylifera]